MRRLALAGLLGWLVCVGAAAPATAAVTAATVTTAASGIPSLVTGVGPTFTPGSVTISGTSDGTSGDMIKLIEVGVGQYGPRAMGLPFAVGSGGAWSIDLPLTQQPGQLPMYGGGVVYAVPQSFSGTPTAPSYNGVSVAPDYQALTTYNSQQQDFWFIHQGPKGFFDAYGIGDCSVCDTQVGNGTTADRGNYIWYGSGIYNHESLGRYGDERGYIRIDAHNAVFISGLRYTSFSTDAGQLPASVTFSNGAEPSVVDTEAALRCTHDSPFPATNNTECGPLLQTGVQDKMTVQSANGGLRQLVTHDFSSTDNATHYVDVQLPVDVNNLANSQFEASWVSGGFFTANSNSLPGPPGAATMFFRDDSTVPDGSVTAAIGADTFAPAPDYVQLRDDGGEFITAYHFTVSPGHDFVAKQQFDTEASLSAAQADGAAARDQLEGPSVSISSPAGTAVAGVVHVTGTASDSASTPTVKVNGVAATVSGGAFAADIPLGAGPQTITAVATDGAGNTAQATASVVVFASPDTKAPKLTLSGVPKSVKLAALKKSGVKFKAACDEACALGADLLGTARGATLSKVGDLTLGSTSAKLGTGTRKLTLKVSKKLRGSLRRKAKLRVSVTATDAAGNRSTTTKTVKIS